VGEGREGEGVGGRRRRCGHGARRLAGVGGGPWWLEGGREKGEKKN
jgi:hypothetical protein